LRLELAHDLIDAARRVGVLAVGQQHDGVDPARVGALGDLLHAGGGRVVDRRPAVGDEVRDDPAQLRAVALDGRDRHERLDAIGEDRQADVVLWLDLRDERREALLGARQAVLLRHRARRVEDEQDVRGLAIQAPRPPERVEHPRLGPAELALGLLGVDAV
jgi:hypothetical protein